jgi:hypothetical protein
MSDLPQSVFAACILQDSPVTAPGVPKNYPDAQKLVTADCIQPVA